MLSRRVPHQLQRLKVCTGDFISLEGECSILNARQNGVAGEVGGLGGADGAAGAAGGGSNGRAAPGTVGFASEMGTFLRTGEVVEVDDKG